MARLTKAYFSKFHQNIPVRTGMTLDEVRKFQTDFNGGLESGESVDEISWTNASTDATLSIATATLSSGIASCFGTAEVTGTARLYCIATLNTGRVLKVWFRVRIKDEGDVR